MCTACGSPRKHAVSSSETKTSGRSAIASDAVDRVVIGDRHEVHPPALGEGIDLLRRRGALGQAERALDAELRLLRRRGVAVEVRAAGLHVSGESSAVAGTL